MGRGTKFLAAFIAVVALGGVVAVGAQTGGTQTTPVTLCITKGGTVRLPSVTATPPCTSKEQAFTAASAVDARALATRMDEAEADIAALEEENLAQAEQLAELDERLAAFVPAIASELVNGTGRDWDIHITASGLEPNSALNVATHDGQTGEVRSSTSLVVDADGNIDETWNPVSNHVPEFGDYVTATGTGRFGQPVQYDSRTA